MTFKEFKMIMKFAFLYLLPFAVPYYVYFYLEDDGTEVYHVSKYVGYIWGTIYPIILWTYIVIWYMIAKNM